MVAMDSWFTERLFTSSPRLAGNIHLGEEHKRGQNLYTRMHRIGYISQVNIVDHELLSSQLMLLAYCFSEFTTVYNLSNIVIENKTNMVCSSSRSFAWSTMICCFSPVNSKLLHKLKLNSVIKTDLGSITFRCNRLHYNYFANFMINLHYITITSILKCTHNKMVWNLVMVIVT
jgi:hypothetical protein